MRKIKIKKDSDGNIKLVTFTNKMATEKSAKNEPNERVDDFDYTEDAQSDRSVRISELLVEVDRTDVGRKLI